uniref:Hydrogenase maturation factor HypB n=1 Tax=Candidatus Kentrum sp. FW TaxID=2126338 RepID=A0A450TDB9_9GAMM|nr:MAG: hydrogenase nickel incorporation protein HypB [Candidatus Kentron sp. FW]
MCETCGCGLPSEHRHLPHEDPNPATIGNEADRNVTVTVFRDLLSENDHQAAHNREHFREHDVLVINLMSSPGAGKTNLIEATIESLRGKAGIAVIEGDLETENDATRIRAHGVPAIQITTGSACHLDAHMVHNALHRLDLTEFDIVFIENVGNLVCPASFDLGQHYNVVLLSVTEGDDKPAKYPVMFRAADLMLLTKTDLLPYLDDFDPEKAKHHLRALANAAPVISLSTRADSDQVDDGRGNGMAAWIHWLLAAKEKIHFERETTFA